MNLFLDSSILIDVLQTNGPQKSFELISSIQSGNIGYISVITVAEVSVGAYRSPSHVAVQKTNELIANLKVIDLNEKIAKDGGKIQADLINSGKEIEINDCLIAATALASGFNTIVTRNIDHFARIPGFSAITPEQIIADDLKKA